MINVPLDVTRELLGQGSEDVCPVESAFSVACPGASDVMIVDIHRVEFIADGRWRFVSLPWDVRNTLDAIGNGYAVTPRTFTLPIPRDVASIPGFLADESVLSPPAFETPPALRLAEAPLDCEEVACG